MIGNAGSFLKNSEQPWFRPTKRKMPVRLDSLTHLRSEAAQPPRTVILTRGWRSSLAYQTQIKEPLFVLGICLLDLWQISADATDLVEGCIREFAENAL